MDKYEERIIARNAVRQEQLAANAAVAILTGRRQEKSDLFRIVRQFGSSDPIVRKSAVESLSNIRDSRVGPYIARLTSDPSAVVRLAACKALGKMRIHNAKTQLYDALVDDDAQVQCAAAFALGLMGDQAGLPCMARLLRAKGKYRFGALRALNEITRRHYSINEFGIKNAIYWLRSIKVRPSM